MHSLEHLTMVDIIMCYPSLKSLFISLHDDIRGRYICLNFLYVLKFKQIFQLSFFESQYLNNHIGQRCVICNLHYSRSLQGNFVSEFVFWL